MVAPTIMLSLIHIYRQAVIEIHLAAIVQVREHAHTAGDRQNDDGQLDKHILSAEHLTDALHIACLLYTSRCV